MVDLLIKSFSFISLKIKPVIKNALPLFFMALLVYSCKKDGNTLDNSPKDNDAFTRYETKFLEAMWKLNPDGATMAGYNKLDSVLLMPSSSNRSAMMTFTRVQMDSLAKYNPATMTDALRIDYQLIQTYLDGQQWELQQEKAYEWDPNNYNNIDVFAHILNEHYAPLQKRLRSFYQKMEKMPDYYKEAQKQIRNPVPELREMAIDRLTGGANVFAKDFGDSLKKSGIPAAEQKQMLDRAQATAEATRNFATFLKNMKVDKPRSFRLGRELYEGKFKFQIQSASTAQQLYNAAVERKKWLHARMTKTSRELWPKYFGTAPMPKDSLELIAKVIDTLSSKHVKADEFQAEIERQIPPLEAFVKAKDLLTLDSGKPLVVRKEPAYMAGLAGASISSPGPYDRNGNTYYNVGSLTGWSAERAESYLREYNNYTIQILCLHEAIPGHYTQLVYANKTPSLIRSIMRNGAMIEGWAVYSEEMMMDAGFGNKEPEMLLMWYKWHLRTVANTILDYAVHTQNMQQAEAIKLLTKEAFQQKAEADGKWHRVQVSSVQLTSYFSGYNEIINLRDAYKTKMGDKYRVKEFNEKFLSYGSAPVKMIKELMLAKPTEKK